VGEIESALPGRVVLSVNVVPRFGVCEAGNIADFVDPIEKWCISCTVVVGEMFSWAASIVDQLDVFLGYAGVRMFRKIWLAYFRARNASEVLENARIVYRKHYARRVTWLLVQQLFV
jgi:hypothetical protein